MTKMDIDWAFLGVNLLVVVMLMLVPLGVLAGAKFDERYGEKIDAFIWKKLKKFDERKARKTR